VQHCHSFNRFQVFAGTLKELDLLETDYFRFTHPKIVDFRVDLPKLERLAFKNFPMIKIDHLLNLTSLRSLEMKHEEGSNTEEYVHGVFERMPNVKTVVIWRTNSENGKQVYRRQ